MDHVTSLGAWLRTQRAASGLTQAELAERVGCARITIQKIELGKRRPSQQILSRLADVLGLDLSTHARLQSWRSVASRATEPAVAVHPHPLFGRERELAQLQQLLCDPACRMVTLVGPGGVGKSRLALEAVRRLSSHFSSGASLVSLSSALTSLQAASSMAATLGITLDLCDSPTAQVAASLAPREQLLLLDNVEQIPDLLPLMDDVLQAAPHLTVLLTSRIGLPSRWNWIVPIGGLQCYDAALEAPGPTPAASLFLWHVRRLGADPPADADDLTVVEQICRAIEGIPLAIELAAGWARILSFATIAARLARDIDLLTTRQPDMPERHRSMRAVLDEDWRHLSAGERAAIRALAIFEGEFSFEESANCAGISLEVLARLVDLGLVRSQRGCYELRSLMRRYALQAEQPR